jgi:UDP-N-acetylglucosamine:LPS N-acetylglucosamine transferase
LGIPVIVHESDFTLGLANKITARFAAKVLTSFPETKGGEYVGSPVRDSIIEGDAARARQNMR